MPLNRHYANLFSLKHGVTAEVQDAYRDTTRLASATNFRSLSRAAPAGGAEKTCDDAGLLSKWVMPGVHPVILDEHVTAPSVARRCIS